MREGSPRASWTLRAPRRAHLCAPAPIATICDRPPRHGAADAAEQCQDSGPPVERLSYRFRNHGLWCPAPHQKDHQRFSVHFRRPWLTTVRDRPMRHESGRRISRRQQRNVCRAARRRLVLLDRGQRHNAETRLRVLELRPGDCEISSLEQSATYPEQPVLSGQYGCRGTLRTAC